MAVGEDGEDRAACDGGVGIDDIEGSVCVVRWAEIGVELMATGSCFEASLYQTILMKSSVVRARRGR